MGKSKYKRLVDLFVRGVEYTFPDGTPVWLQVLNPFERDSVRREAQIARARIVLAMREHGSDEQARVKSAFYAQSRQDVVGELVEREANASVAKILDGLRNDPDWVEKFQILERGDEDLAQVKQEEQQLLDALQTEYLEEVTSRVQKEREFLARKYEEMDEDTLWQVFLDSWLNQLGDEAAMTEYESGRIAYSARVCEAVWTEENAWDHSGCAGHEERVWETIAEIRQLPEDLVRGLAAALDTIEFSEREAKNSDRQTSSSGSSPLPSEEEASTASTPTETPDTLPGTSSAPSPTPSPSSPGSNSPTTTSLPSTSG